MRFVFPRYEPPESQALSVPVWAGAPSDEVPGLTAIRLAVATPRGSVRIHSVEAYSRGFLMTVESRLPQRRLSAAELRSAASFQRESSHESEIHERLAVKVVFADRTALRVEQAKLTPREPATPEPGEMLIVLLSHSGGSSGDSISAVGRRLWFTRLPPPGLVSISVSWKGILASSSRLTFEADSILDAARTVIPAW